MIIERQRLGVLHTADAREIARADGKNAAGSQRVWIARARLRCGRNESHQPKKQHHYNAHQAPRPRAKLI